MPRPRAATRALFEDTGTRRCGGKFNVFVCKRCGVEILENAYRFAVHLSVCKKATEDDRQLAQQQLSKSKKSSVGQSPRSSVPGDIDIFGSSRNTSNASSLKPDQSYGIGHRNSDFTGYGGNRARMSEPRRGSRPSAGLADIGEIPSWQEEDLWGPATKAEPSGFMETSQNLKEASMKLKQYRNSYDDQYKGTLFDLPFQNGKRTTPDEVDPMWGMMNDMSAPFPAEVMLDQGMMTGGGGPGTFRPMHSEASPFDYMLARMANEQWNGQGPPCGMGGIPNPGMNNFYFHDQGFTHPNGYQSHYSQPRGYQNQCPQPAGFQNHYPQPNGNKGDRLGRQSVPDAPSLHGFNPVPVPVPVPPSSSTDPAGLMGYIDLPLLDGNLEEGSRNSQPRPNQSHHPSMQAGGV